MNTENYKRQKNQGPSCAADASLQQKLFRIVDANEDVEDNKRIGCNSIIDYLAQPGGVPEEKEKEVLVVLWQRYGFNPTAFGVNGIIDAQGHLRAPAVPTPAPTAPAQAQAQAQAPVAPPSQSTAWGGGNNGGFRTAAEGFGAAPEAPSAPAQAPVAPPSQSTAGGGGNNGGFRTAAPEAPSAPALGTIPETESVSHPNFYPEGSDPAKAFARLREADKLIGEADEIMKPSGGSAYLAITGAPATQGQVEAAMSSMCRLIREQVGMEFVRRVGNGAETVASAGSAMSFFYFGNDNSELFRPSQEIDEDSLRAISSSLFSISDAAGCEKLRNGQVPLDTFYRGLETLAGRRFHLTARYWHIFVSNRLFPQDNPLKYNDAAFWGDDVAEERQNAADFVKVMFFGFFEGDGGNTNSIMFPASLKQRFTLDV